MDISFSEVQRKEQEWGKSSQLWLRSTEWVTAVCTGGRQEGENEQVRGWLLVNVQVKNGQMFPS